MAVAGSSVSKGETLVDTARNLEAMRIDMVVIRHGASGAAAVPRPAHSLQRHQRGRRQARAPDPGPARHPHPARPVQADRGPQGRHLRRHPPQPGGAQQHLGPAQAGRRGRRLRPGHAAAAQRARARRHHPAADRGRDPVGRCAQHPPPPARADAGRLPARRCASTTGSSASPASGWRGRRRTSSSCTPAR